MTPKDFLPHLERVGFSRALCVFDARLWEERARSVPLLAHSRLPKDVRTSAVAVISSVGDNFQAVRAIKACGAPVVFVVFGPRWECWRQEETAAKPLDSGNPSELARFFQKHKAALNPNAIYRAKIWGRLDPTARQLEFVDIGLMPLVEGEIGKKVSELLESAVRNLADELGWSNAEKITDDQGKWLIQAPFWLLAAKILQDKKVSKFARIDLLKPEEVYEKLAHHYNSECPDPISVPKSRLNALLRVAKKIREFAALDLMTTEALGHVYESALINEATRKRLGTHCTPSWLIDYMVGRLRPLIANLSPDGRRVFEPACGHAGFLVAALRLLDELRPSNFPEKRESYLRKRLRGVDVDDFSQDVARLALTLADVPNPNGWKLDIADLFKGTRLAEESAKADIVLANPPFEDFSADERRRFSLFNRAAEIFRRTIENLKEFSVFGFVLPQGFLTRQESRECRRYLLEHCEIHEITLFADKVFEYGEAESAIIIGRKKKIEPGWRVSYQRVREGQIAAFSRTLKPSTIEAVNQSDLGTSESSTLIVPEVSDVWSALKAYPRLRELARIGQGLIHHGSLKSGLKRKAKLYELDSPKEGFVPAFTLRSKNQMTHQLPRVCYISIKNEHIKSNLIGKESGVPQVLLNYSRVSRGSWRLKAMLDPIGQPAMSRLLVVRPTSALISINVLWGVLNSPIANVFLQRDDGKRDIQTGQMREMPIPDLTRADLRPLESAVKNYFAAARTWSGAKAKEKAASENNMPLFGEGEKSIESETDTGESLMYLHWRVDCEVMKLYGLPPTLERRVLDLFTGVRRRGVPFDQQCYFPPHFKDLNTLEELLSITAEWEKNSERKLELIEKKIRKDASASELAELSRLKLLTEARGEYFAPLPLPQLRKMRDDMIKMGTWIGS